MNNKLKNKFNTDSIKRYFMFDTYNAIIKKEIIGGITIFLAMCYILSVNPSMIGNAPLSNQVDKFASQYHGGLFLATAISSFVATLFMGL